MTNKFHYPGKQALFNHLGNMLSKQLHMVFRVSDYGCLKLLMLIESLIKGVFEVLHVGKDHIIRLGPLGKLYLGTMHIVRECRGSLLLCNLAPEYLKKYGMQVSVTIYWPNFISWADSYAGEKIKFRKLYRHYLSKPFNYIQYYIYRWNPTTLDSPRSEIFWSDFLCWSACMESEIRKRSF